MSGTRTVQVQANGYLYVDDFPGPTPDDQLRQAMDRAIELGTAPPLQLGRHTYTQPPGMFHGMALIGAGSYPETRVQPYDLNAAVEKLLETPRPAPDVKIRWKDHL